VRGDERATASLVELSANPSTSRLVSHAALAAARHEHQQRERMQREMAQRIVPAMVLGTWQRNGTRIIDLELSGQRCYGHPGEELCPDLPVGEEVAVALVEGAPPVVLYSLQRPFETTGRMGMVVDVRRREGGGHELEIESGNETVTCRASAAVAAQIEGGEIDALGGLPIMAVHGREIAWRLRQRKGRSEAGAGEMRSITLSDFAGYTELRREVTLAMAQHVLALEPPALIEASGIEPALLQLPARGVFASGLPGTGKTWLMLALVGSLRRDIARHKCRAKRAAIGLWAATRAQGPAFERAGRPDVASSLARLREALEAQYAGIRGFGIPVQAPQVPPASELARFAERLLEGYRIPPARVVPKLEELDQLVAAGGSDVMVLTMNKESYIRPYVGEGLNALAAQLRRAENHDDLAVLLLPEAEVLLCRRGHQGRFYTDELVSKLLEVLDGLVASRVFILADGNRLDMVDSAFLGRRLEHVEFHGLREADRAGVIDAILGRHGAAPEQVAPLREALLDLIYASSEPLCELVMADQSIRPLTIDRVLTPALIQNVVRRASRRAIAEGRMRLGPEDLESAWGQEVREQAQRFAPQEIARLLGLDAQQEARIIDVRRSGGESREA
jgi:hypothetical protein